MLCRGFIVTSQSVIYYCHLDFKLCNLCFYRYTEFSPFAINGDWSICRGPGWLLGLIGAPFGPILPCMAPCCPGPDAPRGGAEAEPTQPSCCCMPGLGPPGAISPRRAKTDKEMRNCEKCLSTDLAEILCPHDAMVWYKGENLCSSGGCLRAANMWKQWEKRASVGD